MQSLFCKSYTEHNTFICRGQVKTTPGPIFEASFHSLLFYDILHFMGYEVTATRRRPQRFEDVVGQEFVVSTLQKSITAGKIAHAYLFAGPRGCGKTSSARILARALNCDDGPTATPCGKCSTCTEIAQGTSLDVIEIDGASNTSVNDIRQIKDEVQFPPNSCRYKIYIIDEVHMLSISAFNALLKTIEEPPPYVIFIFATTEIHKVPATIKSRCQQFNFRLVPVELLKDVLAAAAAETEIQVTDEALFWIAREATGSVRDAYTLFDQVAAFSDGYITFEKIQDKLGLAGVDRINPLVEACAENDLKTALTQLDDILQKGISIEQITVDMADYFRNLLLIRAGITKEALLGQNVARFSQKVLASWSSTQLERCLQLMLQLYRDLRYSMNPRYELELAVSRLSWITDYVSPSEMKQAISQVRGMLMNGGCSAKPDIGTTPLYEKKVKENSSVQEPSDRIEHPFAAFRDRIQNLSENYKELSTDESPNLPKENNPSAVISETKSIPVVPFEKLQESLVSFFQNSKNMLATALGQAFGWIDNGQAVRFSVDKPFSYSLLEQEHRQINEVISEFLGRKMDLEIYLDKENAPEKIQAAQMAIPPQVELVRQMFRGTIAG